MSRLTALPQKAANEKQLEEEVKKARQEAEHQKRLKEEESRLQAAQEVRDRGREVASELKGKSRSFRPHRVCVCV